MPPFPATPTSIGGLVAIKTLDATREEERCLGAGQQRELDRQDDDEGAETDAETRLGHHRGSIEKFLV